MDDLALWVLTSSKALLARSSDGIIWYDGSIPQPTPTQACISWRGRYVALA